MDKKSEHALRTQDPSAVPPAEPEAATSGTGSGWWMYHGDPTHGIKLSLGGTIYDPADPVGKMFFNILATLLNSKSTCSGSVPAKAWPLPAPRASWAASSRRSPPASKPS
jgi:hypothetical protein